MGAAYYTDPDLNLLYTYIKGTVTLNELLQRQIENDRSPDRRPGMRIILDVLDGEMDVDLQSMKALVAYLRTLDRGGWEQEPTAVLSRSR